MHLPPFVSVGTHHLHAFHPRGERDDDFWTTVQLRRCCRPTGKGGWCVGSTASASRPHSCWWHIYVPGTWAGRSGSVSCACAGRCFDSSVGFGGGESAKRSWKPPRCSCLVRQGHMRSWAKLSCRPRASQAICVPHFVGPQDESYWVKRFRCKEVFAVPSVESPARVVPCQARRRGASPDLWRFRRHHRRRSLHRHAWIPGRWFCLSCWRKDF